MLRPPLEEVEIDENFKQAVEMVVQYDRASASLLQRRLSIGYARAARLIDQLEAAGVVAPAAGSEPREVLIHSAEDILGRKEERLVADPDDSYNELPANYKVPSDVKLSRASNNPWSQQFSDVYKTTDFKDSKVEFPIPLGVEDQGNLKTESLLDINNLIIAGNPLSQKENLVDTILLTFLLRYKPTELKIILNDLTRYLNLYNGILHLLSPVVNEPDKVISAFKWGLAEADRRQLEFSRADVRDLKTYNQGKSEFETTPPILIITFWDFFSPEIEDALVRLTAQGARVGIHNIVVANQTTGASLPNLIKSNIPARAVFRLTSATESKAIDATGAEKLEPGEMIYKPNYGSTVKLKAIFTPEVNVKEVVSPVKHSY